MTEATAPAQIPCTAFAGTTCIGSGDITEIALKAKALLDRDDSTGVIIFNDATGSVMDVEFRGTAADVARWVETAYRPAPPPRGPGRPRLGVVAREVTLLPRHWDWLATQPGGASVALRRLVEDARRTSGGKDRIRGSQAAAYKFMSAMAGNEPGFEEAARALFAGEWTRLDEHTASWTPDVRDYALSLAADAFATECP